MSRQSSRSASVLGQKEPDNFGNDYREPKRRTIVAALSYVTGSHAAKVGIPCGFGYFLRISELPADRVQRYRSGVPDAAGLCESACRRVAQRYSSVTLSKR